MNPKDSPAEFADAEESHGVTVVGARVITCHLAFSAWLVKSYVVDATVVVAADVRHRTVERRMARIMAMQKVTGVRRLQELEAL